MKKFLSAALIAALTAAFVTVPVSATENTATETISYNYTYTAANGYTDDNIHTREMENLDRGLVAVKTNDGVFLSWRLMDSEDNIYGSAEENVSFDIYRDGVKIATESDKTNYLDTDCKANSKYQVVPAGESLVTTVSHEGDTVSIYTPETGLTAYAVEYTENGSLGKVVSRRINAGNSTFNIGFDADRVFLWDGMRPAENTQMEGVTPLSNNYFDIPIEKPAPETIQYVYPYTNESTGVTSTQATYSFFPADCSAGDLDGDGEYEIIIKWTSSERDVGSPGDPAYSGTVRFAAYKLDGTKLWKNDINLGKNVYSSAHTVQFLVYDFDGDGKSEMICQTSRGSKDAAGMYVSHSAKNETKISSLTDEDNEKADYRGYGRITTGDEYLTVFNGETGKAIDTITLPTSRGSTNGVDYGDDFGNRSNRFLANVAYLDGKKPYAVYLRGYYFGRNGRQRTSIAGVSFDGEKLSPDYRFDTKSGQPGYYNGAEIYVGNGNHNCTVADVDNDGKDEFITGALCMEVDDNNDFKPRWCTFMEHGDALHIGDYDPTLEGFEFFTVHEDEGPNTMSGKEVAINFGMSVINADTGDIIRHWTHGSDTGRGIMANIGAGGYYQVTSSAGTYRSNGGSSFTAGNFGMSQNFRIFWDGDLFDELLDGTGITDWNGNGMNSIFNASGCTKINGTKSNPALQADLFGDWREELVYPTTDGNKLRVFTTTTPTDYKIKTLMHDPVYRSGVAAEQTAYNQPPHVGFYMGEEIFDPPVEKIEIITPPTKNVYPLGAELNLDGMVVNAVLSDGTTKEINTYVISGYDGTVTGEQTVTVTYMGKSDTFTVTVKELSKLEITSPPSVTEVPQGGTVKKDGLIVTAYYDDGESFEVSDYTLNYNTDEMGTQIVTVSYMGKTAIFEITVTEANISALNGTYESQSTAENNSTDISIGAHSGNFTISHKITINSMPAAGNGGDRNSTAGFFMRFMCPPGTAKNDGVGGGWYFAAQNRRGSINEPGVYWKSGGNSGTLITTKALSIGETYTFTYEFTNVGTGNGASMKMTITDESGAVIGTGNNLDLRNLTQSAPHLGEPITYIQIYNQAQENSTSSVTISDASID